MYLNLAPLITLAFYSFQMGDNTQKFQVKNYHVLKDCPNLQQIAIVKNAIELNALVDKKLEILQNVLKQKLVQCRNRLQEITENFNKYRKNKVMDPVVDYTPYFKYKNCVPPDNKDTIIMKKSNILNFNSYYFKRWTHKDKKDFLSLIKEISLNLKYKELINFKKISLTDNKNKEDKLAKYENDLCRIDELELSEIALPLHEDYDWEVISKKLRYRHSPQEYSAMWKLYLHPLINKSEWSRKECLNLQTLALQYKEQDWDGIASALNTNRSGYQCFIYYIMNIKKSSANKWTPEEDKYLNRLIENFRVGNSIPWTKISYLMKNRTKFQIYNRWKRSLQPNTKKGRFLPEEDSVLLTCVERFGLDFDKISKYVTGRTVIQLKTRYNILKNNQSAQWTVEEDKLLVQVLASHGKNINYSKVVHHFPGKTRSNLRIRYMTLKKWMKQHPHSDLSLAPRKPTRLLNHGKSCTTIDTALDELNKKLSSLVDGYEIKKYPKKNKREVLIEQIIVEMMKNQTPSVPQNEIPKTVDSTSLYNEKEKILNLWHLGPKSVQYIKTYSKKRSLTLINNEQKYKEQYISTELFFPPTYPSSVACKTILTQFVQSTHSKSVAYMCLQNKKFDKEWNVLLNIFKSLLVLPLLLVELRTE